MKGFRYLKDVTTLSLDVDACVGCGNCTVVCPHSVFRLDGKKVAIADRDACIECGACAANCPVSAIQVTPGVGCASYIIQSWIVGPEKASCGGSNGCC